MEADTTIVMWHKRLCYMSQKGMQILAERDLLPKVKNVHLDKCVDYLIGKQNKDAFLPRPPMRRKNDLELVHTDIF